MPMQNLAEIITHPGKETRRLEGLPSSTETTLHPDLKTLLNAVLKSEWLPFDGITGTPEGGPRRRDMPDLCAVTRPCSLAFMARSSAAPRATGRRRG